MTGAVVLVIGVEYEQVVRFVLHEAGRVVDEYLSGARALRAALSRRAIRTGTGWLAPSGMYCSPGGSGP